MKSKSYNMLLLTYFMCLLSSGICCDRPQTAIWQVMNCDTTDRAADSLNVSQEEIQALNPGRKLWYVSSGEAYKVPYRTSVRPPASWFTTTSCIPLLHLGYTGCGNPSSFAIKTPYTNATQAVHTRTVDSQEPTSSSTSTILPTTTPLCYRAGDPGKMGEPTMRYLSNYACKVMAKANLTLTDDRDDISFLMGDFRSSFSRYYFSVRRVPQCTGAGVILEQECSDSMLRNWRDCTKTRGGFVFQGCLRYSYEALSDYHVAACNGSITNNSTPNTHSLSCSLT